MRIAAKNDLPAVVLAKQLQKFVAVAALGATLVGLTVLAGWTLQRTALVTWGMGTTIAPNAAACFLLAGISLWLVRKNNAPQPRASIGKAAGALVALTGALTIAEQIFRLDLGIDWLFVSRAAALAIPGARIRMSPIAAAVFVSLGLALLLIDWRTRREIWPAQFLAFAAVSGAAFGLLGQLLAHGSAIRFAVPSIVAASALAFGLIGARAPWAMSGLLVSDTQAASWLRRTTPAALLVFGLIGWLIAKPLLAGGLYSWTQASALAVLYGAILAGFLACIAFIVDRGESKRKRLELALRAGHVPGQPFDPVEEPQDEAELRRRVTTGFTLAILLTCLLSFLSWRMARQATDDAAWMAKTHEVSTTLEATLVHLVDAQAAGQAFALTGSQPFLQNCQAARDAVAADLLRLHRVITDADQQRRLQTLQMQANHWLQSLAGMVAARQAIAAPAGEAELQQGEGLSNPVRATVAEMEVAEQRLLLQRTGRARTAQHFNLGFIALSTLAGTVFLLLAGAAVNRELGVSARARLQVIALNADLEQRVEQRAKALEAEVAARLQTDARLRESEGRLGAILQSAMDAIVTADEQQHIVLFNRAAERLFGCSAAEAVGQPMTRFVPQRFQAAHREYFRRLAETGLTDLALGPEKLLWAVRADGQEFQIEASIAKAVVGEKKLFTVITRDVTERVRAEAVRERLASVIGSSDDAIITKDLKGTIITWNPAAEKMFGYLAAEVIGRPMVTLFPADRAHEESNILAQIARGESMDHFETVRVCKDGHPIDVSVTISPLRDGNGVIVGASKIARDITERKQFEEKLMRSQEALEAQRRMLRSVLDSMVEGLVAADERGQFIIFNPAAARILSPYAENLPPDQWEPFQVYQPDMVTLAPADQHPMARALRGEVSTAEMFVRNPKSEHGVWLEAHAAPLRDESGIARGGVVAFRDITQKKAAELEIRNLNESLEERIAQRTAQLEVVNHELEAFTYSVSHDLRAPLRHILGFANALLEEFGNTLDPRAVHYVTRMQDGAKRMSMLTDELLNLAKTGQKPLHRERTVLSEVVEQIIAMLRAETEGREVEWKIGELPVVDCDPVLVRQIFQNLFSNAIKYSRPRLHAIIEVGQTVKKDVPTIYVRDNGVGFKMEYANKLFGVFQRLHRDEEFEGTGVGLATVHRIVSKHGGQIWAEAEIEVGATFYFTLGAGESQETRTEPVSTPVRS